MVDWPDLLAGFVLGVITSVLFWLIERHQRRHDVAAEWAAAARGIERAIFRPDIQPDELTARIDELPRDRWRRILGPDDFRLLEEVNQALWRVHYSSGKQADAAREHYEKLGRPIPEVDVHILAFLRRWEPEKFGEIALDPSTLAYIEELESDPKYFAARELSVRFNREWHQTKVAFINIARQRSREQYAHALRQERRWEVMRHPVQSAAKAFRTSRAGRLWREKRRLMRQRVQAAAKAFLASRAGRPWRREP